MRITFLFCWRAPPPSLVVLNRNFTQEFERKYGNCLHRWTLSPSCVAATEVTDDATATKHMRLTQEIFCEISSTQKRARCDWCVEAGGGLSKAARLSSHFVDLQTQARVAAIFPVNIKYYFSWVFRLLINASPSNQKPTISGTFIYAKHMLNFSATK